MAITEKYVTSAGAGAHDGSSLANAFSWAEMVTDINATGKAGNRYNVSGSISRTTTSDTLTGAGTITSPIVIRGYSSIIGDYYLGRTNGNGDLITTNMPSVTYTTGRLNNTAAFVILEGINFSGAPSNPLVQLGASDTMAFRCVFNNSSTNAAATGLTLNSSGTRALALDCDSTLSGGSGGLAAISIAVASRLSGCRVKGGPAVGITCSTTPIIEGCTIYGSASHGIAMTSTSGCPTICGNTIVGNTGDGINIVTGATTMQAIYNNCITDNGGYGINGVSASNGIAAAANRLRDNTSGGVNLATDWIAATSYGHVTTDTGGPETDYTNYAGNDFSLITSSPAVAAGIPLYRAIGAIQRSNQQIFSPQVITGHGRL